MHKTAHWFVFLCCLCVVACSQQGRSVLPGNAPAIVQEPTQNKSWPDAIPVEVLNVRGHLKVTPHPEKRHRMHRRRHPRSTTSAGSISWCSSELVGFVYLPVDSGEYDMYCVLDAGQQFVVENLGVPQDETGENDGSNACGPDVWTTPSPDSVTSFSIQLQYTGQTLCDGATNDMVTIARQAGQPNPSPSPGALINTYTLTVSDQETGDELATHNHTLVIHMYQPPALQVAEEDSGGVVITSPNPSASPIMIGQQANIQAQVVGGALASVTGVTLSGVAWVPDQTGTTDVVAGYAGAPTTPPVPVPSPVSISQEGLTTNPLVLYWLDSGTKHIGVTAQVNLSNGIGPLPMTVDVYYPVKTVTSYSASATTAAAGTQVGLYGNTNQQTSPCPTPPSIFLVEALHLGNECTPHGIDWSYQAALPSNGGGEIHILQLISHYELFSSSSKKLYCSDISVSCSTTAPASTPFALDETNAYTGLAQAGGGSTASLTPSLGNYDAPASQLGKAFTGSCTSDQRADTFQDYFMYRPASTSQRPSIPVTLAIIAWSWSGNATSKDLQSWKGTNLRNPATSLTSTASTVLPTWTINNHDLLLNVPADPCGSS